VTLKELMSAADIAKETGIPKRQAENIFQRIAP
jgi:hypothetical protein